MPDEHLSVQDDGGGDLFGSELYEMWFFSIIGAIAVGLSGIFPLLVIPIESGPSLKHGEPAKKLRLMLSFAVGSLLGDVFLHLLPEVWAHSIKNNDNEKLQQQHGHSHSHDQHRVLSQSGMWVITGLLVFMVIEKLMGDESEKEERKMINTRLKSVIPNSPNPSRKVTTVGPKTEKVKVRKEKNGLPKAKPASAARLKHGPVPAPSSGKTRGNQLAGSDVGASTHIKISGYLNLMANVVDNFTHGLAVAGSFCVSRKVGLLTTVAILLHEIPHEIGDFAILLRSGFDRWKAAKAQVLTATGGVLGAVTALTAKATDTSSGAPSWVLSFTSGGFLYIALVTIIPDLLQEVHGWESAKQVACILLGVLAIIIVSLAF